MDLASGKQYGQRNFEPWKRNFRWCLELWRIVPLDRTVSVECFDGVQMAPFEEALEGHLSQQK